MSSISAAGRPVRDATSALVSIPDGALVVDDAGRIIFCGEHRRIPTQFAGRPVEDHRPGFLIPGLIDTHAHQRRTFSGDVYGGGQLLEWLTNCIFPAEALRRGLRIVSGRGIGPATAAALVTSPDDALRLSRDEITRWHAAETGDTATALAQVATIPRFALSVTRETLRLDTNDG